MSQNITKRAWELYRAAEKASGRKFTAADRKGKDSEWAKAMRKAYNGVMKDRRIAAVQNLLKPVPKYNQYSLDCTESSEGQRRQRNDAINHNRRIIAKASERPLNQKQTEEASALKLTVREYHNTKKWAEAHNMSVTEWINHLKTEEEAAKEKEQHDHYSWLSAENERKVAAMRNRRRRY